MGGSRAFERSEDEVWLRCLFEYHVRASTGVRPPPTSIPEVDPRLAGLFEAFRAHPAFAAVTELPSSEEFSRGCAAFLENQPMATLPPATHHALAVYFHEVARAIWSRETEFSDGPAQFAARHLVRSLAHWTWLHAEGTYLREWVARSLGGEANGGAVLDAFVARLVTKLADIVRTAPKAEGMAARVIMLVLAPARRETIGALAGVAPERVPAFRDAIARTYDDIVHELVDGFTMEVADSKARGEDATERASRIVSSGRRLSALTAHAPEAENLILEHAEAVGWDLRRGKQWKALAHLYGMLSELVMRLATRVEKDETQFAFAARAAQALTFLSDARDDLRERIDLAERALRICPGHPTAATMLSFYLASRGLALLREAGAEKGQTRAEARVLYDRAKALDPKDEAVKKLGVLLSTLGG